MKQRIICRRQQQKEPANLAGSWRFGGSFQL
jgi:hypothetical protein